MAQPLSIPLQNGFRFFHHPLPAVSSAHLTVCFPRGETTGLPRSAYIPLDGLGAVSSPVGRHLRQENGEFLSLPTCLLAQAYQRLWLVGSDDVYQQFTFVHHTILSKLPTTLTLAVTTVSHDLVAVLNG